jgi:hypothetical protein
VVSSPGTSSENNAQTRAILDQSEVDPIRTSASKPTGSAVRETEDEGRQQLRKAAEYDIPGRQELDAHVDRNGSNSIAGRVWMGRGNRDQRLDRLELQADRFDLATLRDELLRASFVDLPGVARIGKKPREADPYALGVPSLAILPLADGRSRSNTLGTTLEELTHRDYSPSIRAGAATPLHGRVVDEDPACWDGVRATITTTGSIAPRRS